MNNPERLSLLHGDLLLPQYLPDATLGQVRSVSAESTAACGIEAVVMNTFHLMHKPGASTVKALGGLHKMSGWEKVIVTDSGGFQAYSLIRQNAKYGSLNDNGIIFRPENSSRKIILSPEKCIQLQVSFGSDVLFCLDDCTHIDDPPEEQELSVSRTIAWAKRCRTEFDKLMDEKRLEKDYRPKLFAVVQGGQSEDLRKRCAEALLEIGFDGYGYGGWPLDSENALVEDMLGLVRELIPSNFLIHALGIGHPPYIARCTAMGYDLFDSAMPTRDARHGRLYTFKSIPEGYGWVNSDAWFGYLYINDEKHIKTALPIDENCSCPICESYSVGYLRHLFKVNDGLYHQLATMHNLTFMSRLMSFLRSAF